MTAEVVQARIKYFHRLDFPFKPTGVGSGWRVEYDIDAFLRIVVAFELLAAGVAPVKTVALVNSGWAAISRAFARGWTAREERGAEPSLMLLRSDGLDSERPGTGTVRAGREADLRGWANLTAEVMRAELTEEEEQAAEKGELSADEDRRLIVVEARRLSVALIRAMRKHLKLDVMRRTEVGIDRFSLAALAETALATGT
ncbi:MAG: hypothetical protein KGJ57_21200 [Sphingomonadales bacterium]|nr:hypothetical protein [Sphingomonadales bacterium]MDE2171914.1 hypothetical protein [Sphingomonadales bacterium]